MTRAVKTIPNDNPDCPVDSLPPNFVAAITKSQIDANKGWAPENADLIDHRVFNCPDCGSSGMNTCWGYLLFVCGAEVLSDGSQGKRCCEAA